MNEKHPAPQPDTTNTLDPNTTLDIVANYNGSVTELSNTVDAMDGAETKVIEIVNNTDGTAIEVTVIEEPTDQPGIDSVDRFVRIEGMGRKWLVCSRGRASKISRNLPKHPPVRFWKFYPKPVPTTVSTTPHAGSNRLHSYQ